MAYVRSMPRVPRSSLVRLAAPPDAVAAATVERLGATLGPTGSPTRSTTGRPTTTFVVAAPVDRQLVGIAHRRTRTHAIETLRAALDGRPDPPPPKSVVGLPPVAFSPQQS